MVTSEYITAAVDNTPNDTLGFDHVSKDSYIMSEIFVCNSLIDLHDKLRKTGG